MMLLSAPSKPTLGSMPRILGLMAAPSSRRAQVLFAAFEADPAYRGGRGPLGGDHGRDVGVLQRRAEALGRTPVEGAVRQQVQERHQHADREHDQLPQPEGS